MAETCADASSLPLIVTGDHTFSGNHSGFFDDLDLEAPGPSCTSSESAGEDGIVRVRLQPGETLTARYEQLLDPSTGNQGDGVLYLLSNCLDTTSALACDDQIGTAEVVEYTYLGSTSETLFLVLDNWNPLFPGGPFQLDLLIQ